MDNKDIKHIKHTEDTKDIEDIKDIKDIKDIFLKKAFSVLHDNSLPTETQKEIMLQRTLFECNKESNSYINKLRGIFSVYPWRLAFAISAVQTTVFTLIFGTQYTNMLFSIFGG